MNEDGTPRQGLVNSSCKFAGHLVPQLKRRMEIHHAPHVCSHVDGMRRLIENYEIRKNTQNFYLFKEEAVTDVTRVDDFSFAPYVNC